MSTRSSPDAESGAPQAAEAALVARLRAGDPAAYAVLVRTHSGRLLAVIRRVLRNDEDARDALQETFLSALRGIASFHAEARLSTWLHRIALNCALMKLRSRRGKPEEPIDDLLPTFAVDGHAMHSTAAWCEISDRTLERRQLCAAVREAIDRLPDSYRTVLLLRDIEELDTEETAQMLGLTANNVKIRLHRARMALRALLDPQLREDPSR